MPAFDVQAHRGGIGLTTESTAEAFHAALSLGVSTLELDTRMTADGELVVWHDARITAEKCRDTAPAYRGDPLFPYVGRLVKDLTFAQLRTLDLGVPSPRFPDQRVISGARMLRLRDVLDLVAARGADVRLNIETKVVPDVLLGGADLSALPTAFAARHVPTLVDELLRCDIPRDRLGQRVMIQSFDWSALRLVHDLAPDLPLVALIDDANLHAAHPGRPGAPSPWLGGVDLAAYDGDVAAAAASITGVRAISPCYGYPDTGRPGDPGFQWYADSVLVRDAHDQDLAVIPWTCDDPLVMAALIDVGVDGIITNYPDRLRSVLAERGMPLPSPAPQ